MISRTLKLFKYDSNGNATAFPSEADQIEIGTYKYSAKRMGNAPSITATVNHPINIDSEWSDFVGTEFRGERYYLKTMPTSSMDNTSMMYKYQIELVSERVALEHVYFFDVVAENTTNDKPVSNNSTFSFSLDIEEFIERLNRSLKWSGLDYTVVLDEGVEKEYRLYESQDQFIYNALNTAYEVYEVPYYFVGKVIHFGYYDAKLDDVFRYGCDNALMSISKNVTNSELVNRITGLGSDRNITYYYPNPTPKGVLKLEGGASDNYRIVDQLAFSNKVDLGKPVMYSHGVVNILDAYPVGMEYGEPKRGYEVPLRGGTSYTEYMLEVSFTFTDTPTMATFRSVPIFLVSSTKNAGLSERFIEGVLTTPLGDKVQLSMSGHVQSSGVWRYSFSHDKSEPYYMGEGKTYTLSIKLGLKAGDETNTNVRFTPVDLHSSEGYLLVDKDQISDIWYGVSTNMTFAIDVETPRTGSIGRTMLENSFLHLSKNVDLSDHFISGDILYDGEEIGIVYPRSYSRIDCGVLDPGPYKIICRYSLPFPLTSKNIGISSRLSENGIWMSVDSELEVKDFADVVQPIDGYTPKSGDVLTQAILKRVNVQTSLMPPKYRDTDGKERFYDAENNTYKDEDGNDIVFNNPYTPVKPREHIYSDDEIYPSITGIKNADNEPIDEIIDIAFDENDNDEIWEAGTDNEGKYKHPYFFVKLRRTNGEFGFNLYDSAIENEAMTISFTSGKCMACEFNIGVDEEYSRNTVRVDANGNLMRDDEGNVLCNRRGQPVYTAQPEQQDTQNNEVWIALKKEDQTFGVIMPNRTYEYLPAIGDTFVILHIDLPDAYVYAAEDRLEKAMIKYMAENNDYKFNYSVKLSSIFFEENPAIAQTLSENSKLTLEYGGKQLELYVTSYSCDVNDNSILPSISLELDDSIKIFKSAFDRVKEDIDDNYKKPLVNIQNNTSKIGDRIASIGYKADTIKTTADKAMEQSTSALDENKIISSTLSDVKLSVADVEVAANLAQTNATQAKEGVVNIGNEIGVINTSINRVQSDATKALSLVDDAAERIEQVSSETTSEVIRINETLSEIDNDVNSLESLIGDEYNIWFEEGDSIGRIPTLDNFPAKDWTEDDYEDHDRDLYYSQTLGRAWRFNYNEGSPLWEEITDADTITALTRAQEALDKADEAMQAVHDLDYLKATFGEAEVMNEKAVILGRMLAVTDDDGSVTAGVYGGGVDELNEAGYKDADHGTLMMFAGTDDVQSPEKANFRVYSDGCLFANSGTFGGIIKRSLKKINMINLYSYIYLDANGVAVLDLVKAGTFIQLDLPSIRATKIRLPWYSSAPGYTSGDNLEDVLSILGAEVIVKLMGTPPPDICFEVGVLSSLGDVTPACLNLELGSLVVAKCKVGSNEHGVNVGWDITII